MLLAGIFTIISSASIANGQFIVEILQPPTGRGMRHPVQRCEATGANFGPDVASFSFSQHAVGCPVFVSPGLACSNVTYEPIINASVSCTNMFAVVPRGTCNFSEKAYHVQRAEPQPLTAILVYNEKGKPPVDMNRGKYAEEVKIPILMVSYDCMVSMMEEHPPSAGYLVQIKISPGYYDLFRYLIPFVVVVGFCFMVLLISLFLKAIRLCRERRRIARKRLSKRNLRKIPTKKYRKGDYPETCAICLEDFIEGEKLRVLACRHTYHCLCIDPWLTQNRKVCPMCKRRVGAKNSDSESSDEERNRHDQPSTSGQSEQPTVNVTQVDEESDLSFDPTQNQPESSSMSNVLVEVHHNSHMGSQEQLVDEDFLAHMTNHESEDEAEPQESLSQSFRKKLKNMFNRSGHSPLEEEEDFSHDNSAFHGSTPSMIEAPQQPAPSAQATEPEGSGYQFRDPFEHHDEDPPAVGPSATHGDPAQ